MFPSCLLARCGIPQTSRDSPRPVLPLRFPPAPGVGGSRLSPFPRAAHSGQGGSRRCPAGLCSALHAAVGRQLPGGDRHRRPDLPRSEAAPSRAQPTRRQWNCLGLAATFTRLEAASLCSGPFRFGGRSVGSSSFPISTLSSPLHPCCGYVRQRSV